MRDRIRITRTAPGEWTVHVPAFGFGQPEATPLTTWRAAMAHADARIQRPGSTCVDTDRPNRFGDGIAAVSPWTPLWYPHASAPPQRKLRTTT